MMKSRLRLFQWAVGACDSCTGVLLVLFPAWTLGLMGITRFPQPVDIISFVGVFVMAVGGSYFLVSGKSVPEWRMQWKVTALVRLAVACFLAWKIFGSEWEIRWISVLLTDLVIGVTQVAGIRRGWLEKR